MARVDPQRARSALRERLAATPDDGSLWGVLGDLERASGRRAEAHAAYARARELYPYSLTYEIRWRATSD
jgi:cytochrome c-type biogenesis protein CcmH/NrfG